MEKVKYIPSFNLKNIPFDKYEKNFMFIVDNKRYHTTRLLADILSPNICQLHYIDESCNEFCINTDKLNKGKAGDDVDYFKDFLNLYDKEEILLDKTRLNRYGEYFLKLGNTEEYTKLHTEKVDEFTVKYAINFFNQIDNDFLYKSKYNKMIQFLSEHFYEIDNNELKSLDYEILDQILRNDHLKLKNEDLLVELLIEKYKEDEKYSSLFEYVIFNNISEENLSEFINVFNISDINSGIWNSLCKRLLPKDKNASTNRYRFNLYEFKYTKGYEFNGIMKHLTELTGGNIHENKTIEITSNSYQRSGHPMNLVDYKKNSEYHSNNDVNTFICFDFKDKKVQITNYSIKSESRSKNNCHLRNWVIEGSNDNNQWEIIDEHSNDSSLNSSHAVSIFNTKNTSESYRYIRLRQTGPSWNYGGPYYLFIANIEFFGKLMY